MCRFALWRQAGLQRLRENQECRSRRGQCGLSLLHGHVQVHFLLTLSVPTPTSFPIPRPTLLAPWLSGALPRSVFASLAVLGVARNHEHSTAPSASPKAPTVCLL